MKPVKPIDKQKIATRIQISSRTKSLSHSNINKKRPINPKLESINQALLSKIDNILGNYKGHDNLIPDVQNSISTNPQSEITNQIDEIQTPLSASSFHKSEKQLPKIKPKKLPQKIKKGKKDDGTFMTGAGLTKPTKKPVTRKNKFIAKTDKEINDMINNINDIDNMFTKKKDDSNIDDISFEGSPEFRKKMEQEMADFKALVDEIDGYKQELREEFDEVKYLIKFADNTHRLIDRHKNVMGSIFKGAGLKTRSQLYAEEGRSNSVQNKEVKEIDSEEENEEDDSYKNYSRNSNNTSLDDITGVFNKLKKINQIKDNLGNIQDSFLDYHKRLKENIQRAQSAKRPNTTLNNII